LTSAALLLELKYLTNKKWRLCPAERFEHRARSRRRFRQAIPSGQDRHP
jgi:hypothetical protein